jgi:octaprenyl-diphosphate synthase
VFALFQAFGARNQKYFFASNALGIRIHGWPSYTQSMSLENKSGIEMPAKVRAPQIQLVHDLIASDMTRLNDTLRAELRSDVELINQIADYLIGAGGKRLRPMLVFLCAKALGANDADQARTASLAAIVELIHTATLLHDDVVDESEQRRNRKTANALWGNAASVLVGDFLYSRSFQMMVRLQSMDVMQILANATNAIAEGEVLQLIHKGQGVISRADYEQVIERKTAVLFEAACRLGALCKHADSQTQATFAEFGMRLGFAFQIADDLLDYTGDASVIGKNLGDDLAEGKSTLPIIFAAERADAADAEIIQVALKSGERAALPELIRIMRSTDALDATQRVAEEHAERAIRLLQDVQSSAAKDALMALARFAVSRQS